MWRSYLNLVYEIFLTGIFLIENSWWLHWLFLFFVFNYLVVIYGGVCILISDSYFSFFSFMSGWNKLINDYFELLNFRKCLEKLFYFFFYVVTFVLGWFIFLYLCLRTRKMLKMMKKKKYATIMNNLEFIR